MPQPGYFETGLAFLELSAEKQKILKDRIQAAKEVIPPDKAGRSL
jgi:hypothetical protein